MTEEDAHGWDTGVRMESLELLDGLEKKVKDSLKALDRR
jgi:hypothetical protein